MSHQEQLKNRSYKRWIRGSLGFRYLQEGLVHTVDTIVRKQHESYVKNLSNTECDKCTTNTLLPNHPKIDNKCTKGRNKCFCMMHKNGRFCPNFFCSAVYDNIVDDHRNQEPNWLNTDITKWGNNYVEVAKCFISSSGYRDKFAVQEVDCSGLLNIVTNNKAFDSSVTKVTALLNPLPIFFKARDHRNSLFHSTNMEITDIELNDMLDNMIHLLQLPGILDNGDTELSIQKLQKLKDDEIFISLRDEIEIQQETIQKLDIKQKESIDEIEQSKQDLLDKVKNLNGQCETQMTTLNERMQTTDKKLENIEQDLKASCTNLEKICKDLEHRQSELHCSLAHLQTAVGNLTTRCNKSNLRQKVLEEQIWETISEIPNIIKSYLSTKSENEREILVMEGLASSRMEKLKFAQRKQDLQNKLRDYYKRCLSTIPVSPILKTISGSVDEVFVELSICEDLKENKKPEEEEQVMLYKDILLKDNDLCKNVYLLGNAGMGKTTWCKKVLSTWVNVFDKKSENSDIESVAEASQASNSTDESKIQANEDEQCLRQFDILFYIALRQQSQQCNIMDMVKEHPVVTEYSLEPVVDEIIRNEPDVCLFLLDGLDEWTPKADVDIPGRVCLHGSPVVTTSRPYRLVGIHDSDDTFHADRIVRMTGIRDKELLVRKVIQQLNCAKKENVTAQDQYESSENDYKRFMKDVKGMKDRDLMYHRVLPGYMDIPLMLIIMVCLWFVKGKFEITLAKNIWSMIEYIINHAEGCSRGIFKRKKAATGKLEGISNLNELKEKWSKSAEILPSTLSKNVGLRGYSELIYKVSYLAFQSLFNLEHKIQLTFSQDDLLQYFNEEELRVIVRIGILSQSEVTESPLCPMTKLSFIHKAFHECFAGLYITIQFNRGRVETVDMLQQYFRDPVSSNLPDIDNAPLFVGGIDPRAGSKLSEYLFEGLTLDIYKTHAEYFNTFYLRHVQVVHENDENYPSEEFPIYTEYILVPDNLAQEKMKYLQLLFDTNISHLKHTKMPCKVAGDILEKINSDKLQDDFSLCIYAITPSVCDSLSRALHCIPKLQNVSFHGLYEDCLNADVKGNLDLTGCSCLKDVSLKDLSNITIITKSHLPLVTRDNADECEIRISK